MKISRCLILLILLLTWTNAWAQIKIRSHAIRDREKIQCEIDIRYPQLSIPDKPVIQKKLNALLKENIQNCLDAFRVSYQEEYKFNTFVDPDCWSWWYLHAGYNVAYNTPRLLVLYQYITASRWPHNNCSDKIPFLIDLKTYKQIKLKQIFKQGAPYLKVLSEYSRKTLPNSIIKLKYIDIESMEWIYRGTEPTEDNFSIVYPTARGLLIFFRKYQVAPGVCDSSEIIFPYKSRELSEILDPDGPLGQYATKPLKAKKSL